MNRHPVYKSNVNGAKEGNKFQINNNAKEWIEELVFGKKIKIDRSSAHLTK